MRTYIFLPPVKKATGGITVLLQIARALVADGREAYLVPRGKSGWTPDGLENAAPEVAWDELALTPDDLWLVPEGWVNALAPGLNAGARCVNYVQNWAYLFSAVPEGVHWSSLNVRFLSVSDPVAHFVRQAAGAESLILRPGIDLDSFHAPAQKPSGTVRIAYMPRKNKALARQIRDIFTSRNPSAKVRWVEIQDMNADQVAESLRQSHVFLATGFPEGCPLPPLEAMASGCLCVGFSGYGGWDYMRPAQPEPRFTPWWPVRETAWSGNGLWCADADVLDAALCLEQAVNWVSSGADEWTATMANALATAQAYSMAEHEKNILRVWDELGRA